MLHTKITCYRAGMELPAYYFFILNKGNNSGKPLRKACPNCFIYAAESYEDCEFFYWLCYGLWQSNSFFPMLVGSVIPFIRKHDIVQVIELAEMKARTNYTQFEKCIEAMDRIHRHKAEVLQHLQLLELQGRKALNSLLNSKAA